MRIILTVVFVCLIAVIIVVMIRKFITQNRQTSSSFPVLAVDPETSFLLRTTCKYIGTAIFDQQWKKPKNKKMWKQVKAMLFLNKEGVHIFFTDGSFTIPMKTIKKIYVDKVFFFKKTNPTKKIIIEWKIGGRLRATGIRLRTEVKLQNFMRKYNKVSKVSFAESES